jgi:hypothetical protein
MSPAAVAILLAVEFACGAGGGVALGRWRPGRSFGPVADGAIGGIGGLAMVWLAGRIPGLGRFVGYAASAADSTMQGVGGVTPAILVGVGIAGLMGGIVLLLLAGTVGTLARG